MLNVKVRAPCTRPDQAGQDSLCGRRAGPRRRGSGQRAGGAFGDFKIIILILLYSEKHKVELWKNSKGKNKNISFIFVKSLIFPFCRNQITSSGANIQRKSANHHGFDGKKPWIITYFWEHFFVFGSPKHSVMSISFPILESDCRSTSFLDQEMWSKWTTWRFT